MSRYLEEEAGSLKSLDCKAISFAQLRAGSSPMAQRILKTLGEKPRYGNEIAKLLNVHEQRIHYHLTKLAHAGLIVEQRRVEINGASAKYYTLAQASFAVLLQEPKPTSIIRPSDTSLAPFISNGKADFLIVVGSPDAHGPRMARSKDGNFATDLALFLGTYVREHPRQVLRFDTELKQEELQQNLIIIGGPIVNTVAARINPKLPIRFMEDGRRIESIASKKIFDDESVGFVVKTTNPFSKDASILCVAGVRLAGTRSAILAITEHPEWLGQKKLAHVVRGSDENSDGVIDSVTVVE